MSLLAEKEGFEPPVPFGTLVFKTSALNRSAISPVVLCKRLQIYALFFNLQTFQPKKSLFFLQKSLFFFGEFFLLDLSF